VLEERVIARFLDGIVREFCEGFGIDKRRLFCYPSIDRIHPMNPINRRIDLLFGTGIAWIMISLVESEFLRYLLTQHCQPGARLPSLGEISTETGISIGKLREQLEVARALGLVEVGPRRGIRFRGYEFLPAVRLSLMVALSLDRHMFRAFSTLRIHLENAFWDEAVPLLEDGDKAYLRELVSRAFAKLNHDRIQIPHPEHRELHLTIFRRLDNPFVRGLLEAYWDAYEAVELNTYADYTYLQEVWGYHERIVAAICAGDIAGSKALLGEHHHLLDKMGNSHEALAGAPGAVPAPVVADQPAAISI
jgi:DNA-binding FadR family transcriptional regulator